MSIESVGLSNASVVTAKQTAAVEKPPAELKAQIPSTSDRVTISSEARALFQRSQNEGASPLSAGGTTLPPWPPSLNSKDEQGDAITPLSAGGTTLPPWPPSKQV